MRQARKDVLSFLRAVPRIGNKLAEYAMRGEWSFKSFFTPGMLFEAFRFTYIGPVNGHDIPALRRHLQMAAAVEDGPVLLHVRTHKGRGYAPAEQDPVHFHGVGHFHPETGMPVIPGKGAVPSFTAVFGRSLADLAGRDRRIVAITAAMPEGTGTSVFQERFPDRFVDVGICEQHAVTFAAGLACQGYRPAVAIYSTFLQRAYDQIVHDVCLQNLPVTFCIDRAGLVGEDGATHHGVFDMAYLRHIPNISLLATACALSGPCAIRYPRGAGYGVPPSAAPNPLPAGEGEVLQDGEGVAVIAVGSRVHPALRAAASVAGRRGITPLVFDPVWIKPLPEAQIADLARRFRRIVIVEEGCLAGGVGAAVLEFLNDARLLNGQRIRRMGIGDAFVEHGSQTRLREECGIRAHHIAAAIESLLDEQA